MAILTPDPTNIGAARGDPATWRERMSRIIQNVQTVLGVGAGSGVDADLLDGQHGAHYLARANHTGIQAATTVEVLEIGTATYDDVQDFINLGWSGGQLTGGEVTDGGSETVDCAAATGMIRDANSVTSNILFFDIAADNLAIATGVTKFVRINYNSGTPIWETANTEALDVEDIIDMAKVTNDGGTLHISTLIDHVGNVPRRLVHTLKEVFGVRRADNVGGLILGEGGTRYITLTAGELYYGVHENIITSKDTDPGGAADVFDTDYFDGSVWVTTTGVSQWPNTQYNDITTGLVTLGNNKWAVLWFYVEVDDELAMVYGSAQYVSMAAAELETAPVSLPAKLVEHGVLIGRLVFQKSAATAEVESVFVQAFVPSQVTSHDDLANLNVDGQHPWAVQKTTFNAQSYLKAISDDTPVVQAVADSEFMGRAAGEDLGVMTAAQAAAVLTLLLLRDGTRAMTGVPPATPAANSFYKHPNAGGQLATTIDVSSTEAAIAGALDAAQGGIGTGALEDWHEVGAASEPTFANSWVNFGAGAVTAAFRKLPTGEVYIKGLIKDGTVGAGVAMFTLPVGYRPPAYTTFAVRSNNAFGITAIRIDGVVAAEVGNNAFHEISCSFMAGA